MDRFPVDLSYSLQLPQSALGSKSPLHAMKDWHKLKPQMFKKQPYYLPGWDSYDTKVQTNIDPQSWRVINGKLYISYDPVSAAEFDTIPDLIERADANWAVRQASKVVE